MLSGLSRLFLLILFLGDLAAGDIVVKKKQCPLDHVATYIRIDQNVLMCKTLNCRANAVKMKTLRLGQGEFYRAGRIGEGFEYDVIRNVRKSSKIDDKMPIVATVFRVFCDRAEERVEGGHLLETTPVRSEVRFASPPVASQNRHWMSSESSAGDDYENFQALSDEGRRRWKSFRRRALGPRRRIMVDEDYDGYYGDYRYRRYH